jgi:hypothetical protein
MRSNLIEINNLNDRQLILADILWECKDMQQVNRFIESLPTKQWQIDARSLVELFILTNIDNIIDGTTSLKAANELINRVK